MSDLVSRIINPSALNIEHEIVPETLALSMKDAGNSQMCHLGSKDSAELKRDSDLDIKIIKASGLFDEAFYLTQNIDVQEAEIDPLKHFYEHGWKEHRQPNPYFDCDYYIEHCNETGSSGIHPLVHYIQFGDQEGRRPTPLFNPDWYRAQQGLGDKELTLSHYLQNCQTGTVSPHPEFDSAFYAAKQPDVVAAGLDLFNHFLNSGVFEGRAPSKRFDPRFYAARYLPNDHSTNPFLDWLSRKDTPGVLGCMTDSDESIPRQVKVFTKPGPDFEELCPLSTDTPRQAKILALYLPQFHAFKENDEWWGKGFTEWTNLNRGLPRFKGHYQPRTPRDLGHYNLGVSGTMRKQADMAHAAGIHGFVFYHYWFNGKRIMEKPIEQLIEDPSIALPFCVMWANENWTRRWDGLESEVLIRQDYNAADDERMVAEYVRYFRDPRYIRVCDNRPLLIIYRPGLIPDARKTVERWRSIFREKFMEDPVIIMSQAFGDEDPRVFGLDGAMEFPPHKLCAELPQINEELSILDPDFSGNVFRYSDVVLASVTAEPPPFPLIRGIMPGWDNDARRQGTGMVIHAGTPWDYQVWLTRMIGDARARPFYGEPFVCVNAWNEWAEGAYLEPDLHFGAAFLNATGRAAAGLNMPASASATKILLIGHDAHLHGAQELLLNIGRTLKSQFGISVHYMLLDDGILVGNYAKIGKVTIARTPAEQRLCLTTLHGAGFDAALVNTAAAAGIVIEATRQGIRCINLVHELPLIINQMNLGAHLVESLRLSAAVVFPSPFVRDAVLAALKMSDKAGNYVLQPQGVYKTIVVSAEAALAVQVRLGMRPQDALVVGAGYGDLRKGFDLFLQAWRLTRGGHGRRLHFCWLGKVDPSLTQWMARELEEAVAEGSFHLPGFTDDMAGFMSAASVLALTSREDPFPSVALEALSAGVPVVAFDKSGGIPDLLRQHGVGEVVPYGNTVAMARSLRRIAARQEPEERARRQRLIATTFGWSDYVHALVDFAKPGLPKISVAVPNYNYACYLPARLGSIFAQMHPVYEVIVLDDCSTDNSLDVVAAVSQDSGRQICLMPNHINSGSVFAQWRKGAEMAHGEFVWIAEADDLSDPTFLGTLLKPMLRNPTIGLAFSDSRTIDGEGVTLGDSYKSYFAELEPDALGADEVYDGRDFVSRFLAVQNLILNVSSVVWRRDVLLRALKACQVELSDYRMAGDWLLYLYALQDCEAKIAYVATPLNVHRRHAKSVTHALANELHASEIKKVQQAAVTLFQIPLAVQRRQGLYHSKVLKQFGCTEPTLIQAATIKKRSRLQPRPSKRSLVGPVRGVLGSHTPVQFSSEDK